MNITEKSYVAEWSHTQQQFHLQTVREMIEKNLQACRAKRNTEYVPIGFFDTMEAANEFTKQVEKSLG